MIAVRHQFACSADIEQISQRIKMYGNVIIAVLLEFVICVAGNITHVDNQLYEGSNCALENGKMGICKKLPECQQRLTEVQEGKRDSLSPGRCGFDGLKEIVCCPVTNESDKLRPADLACIGPEGWPILEGRPVKSAECPYAAALGYENSDSDIDGQPIKYSCGGTLISVLHVLTAAHCVNNIHEKIPVHVRLGDIDLSRNNSETQVIPISEIISHPLYRRSTFYNDIAILKLKSMAIRTEYVWPACIQTQSLQSLESWPDSSLIVIGWGSTSFDNDGSPLLMKTREMSVVERQDCAKHYTGFMKLPRSLDENMFCAIDANSTGRSDACQGDSGGPLIHRGIFQTIVGITAFGQSCGGPIPAVYTSVYPYADWIENHVWQNDSYL